MSIAVEAVCASVDDARSAQEAGVTRIELVSAISDGGLTPSFASFLLVHEAVTLSIATMIRPRPGGFCYSDTEFGTMQRELELFAAKGLREAVIGILLPDGSFDTVRMKALMDIAPTVKFVCHRAFDLTPDPLHALDQLIELGFSAVLTAGRAKVADANALAVYVAHARGRIEIVAAGGVRASNVKQIVQQSGVTTVHLGPTRDVWDPTSKLETGVSYGPHLVLDQEEIRKTVAVLN